MYDPGGVPCGMYDLMVFEYREKVIMGFSAMKNDGKIILECKAKLVV